MAKTKFCRGISDISDTYMGMIVDGWGVLHDGKSAYEGAVDCLKELKERKKTVIIISNSHDTEEENKSRLKSMGITPSLYGKIICPGEMIISGISEKDGIFSDSGNRCYLLGHISQSIIENASLEITDNIEDAEFVLISSELKINCDMKEMDSLLRRAIQRRLKAFSLNPDSHDLLSMSYAMGAGLVARKYRDFGGVVHYIGKPHKPIFQKCIRFFQEKDIYPGQVVMIGDTMAHDILGGSFAEIDTCLVKNGIHKSSFINAKTPAEIDMALSILINQYNNAMPNYLVDRFEWGMALPDRKHKIHKKHVIKKRRIRKSS